MIVLVHGWGYDAGLWDPVRAHLPGLPVLTVDLGFSREPRNVDPALWPEPTLAVGHSFGFLWLLARARARCPTMLAVNGFPCFTTRADFPAGVPRRVVATMARRFETHPGEVLAAFRERCGGAPGPAAEEADLAQLAAALTWLMEWDERPALRGLHLHALAGRDDAIVPPAMTAGAFPGAALTWVEDGRHVLPWQHPEAVAAQIRRLWQGLSG